MIYTDHGRLIHFSDQPWLQRNDINCYAGAAERATGGRYGTVHKVFSRHFSLL